MLAVDAQDQQCAEDPDEAADPACVIGETEKADQRERDFNSNGGTGQKGSADSVLNIGFSFVCLLAL